MDRGAEPGVKTVTASSVHVLLKQISQEPVQGLYQTDTDSTTQNATGLATSAPVQPPIPLSESEVKHVANKTDLPPPQPPINQTGPPSPELASDLVDLDIICIDEEMELLTRETMGGSSANSAKLQSDKMQKTVVDVVDLVESSSSETEDSSDVMDESDNDRENRSVR